jgi:hypothetical protein
MAARAGFSHPGLEIISTITCNKQLASVWDSPFNLSLIACLEKWAPKSTFAFTCGSMNVGSSRENCYCMTNFLTPSSSPDIKNLLKTLELSLGCQSWAEQLNCTWHLADVVICSNHPKIEDWDIWILSKIATGLLASKSAKEDSTSSDRPLE